MVNRLIKGTLVLIAVANWNYHFAVGALFGTANEKCQIEALQNDRLVKRLLFCSHADG